MNGPQERQAEGAYYLEWRENGRRVPLSVGNDAADASARRQRKAAELHATNNGIAVMPDNGRNAYRSLAATIDAFLDPQLRGFQFSESDTTEASTIQERTEEAGSLSERR